jgi:hypothetical protein
MRGGGSAGASLPSFSFLEVVDDRFTLAKSDRQVVREPAPRSAERVIRADVNADDRRIRWNIGQ